VSLFGLRPFGTESPFGGPGSIAIIGATSIGTHEILVDFDQTPETFDPAGQRSATNTDNWTLTAIDPRIESTADPTVLYNPDRLPVPTRDPLLIAADWSRLAPTQIILAVDSALERGVEYDLEIQPVVEGDACEALAGVTTWRFGAVGQGPPPRARIIQLDRYRDWANEFFPSRADQPESTWTITSNRDIALHDGIDSLRKRIFRRLLSALNAFSHLVGYGTDLRIKSILRPSDVQRLANAIPEQVRQEPDVRTAACTIVQDETNSDGSLLIVTVYVVRNDSRETQYLFEFPGA
jgi:hypothetical protein